jgi:hypothetical protein
VKPQAIRKVTATLILVSLLPVLAIIAVDPGVDAQREQFIESLTSLHSHSDAFTIAHMATFLFVLCFSASVVGLLIVNWGTATPLNMMATVCFLIFSVLLLVSSALLLVLARFAGEWASASIERQEDLAAMLRPIAYAGETVAQVALEFLAVGIILPCISSFKSGHREFLVATVATVTAACLASAATLGLAGRGYDQAYTLAIVPGLIGATVLYVGSAVSLLLERQREPAIDSS